MNQDHPLWAVWDQARCPESLLDVVKVDEVSGEAGFFRWGDLSLYGRVNGRKVSSKFSLPLPELDWIGEGNGNDIRIPYSPSEIIDNLRWEKYVGAVQSDATYLSDKRSLARAVYYTLRPLLPVGVRRLLQRRALKDWQHIPFPRWPVDTSVDDVVRQILLLAAQTAPEKRIPFIWFWPRGHDSCAIMTHDVETEAGRDFCPHLLELEKHYGIRSSFEFVPEVRYTYSERIIRAIQDAGSEVCLHGLCHDGRLFDDEKEFRRRAERINEYAVQYGATGFRSPIMYRNPAWYDAFRFSYDMSLPNTAHLDPQRGGCCTLFPFFIGQVLELPLTTIQDYPLYNVLQMDPLEMWRRQTETIRGRHGLVSFIVHPDYTFQPERQQIYRGLLAMLRECADRHRMWLALPCEVDLWWRQRSCMTLEAEADGWVIRGEGSARAGIGWASVVNGQLQMDAPHVEQRSDFAYSQS